MDIYYELAYMHLTVYQFSSEELPSDPLKIKAVPSVCFHKPKLSSPTTYICIFGKLSLDNQGEWVLEGRSSGDFPLSRVVIGLLPTTWGKYLCVKVKSNLSSRKSRY